MSPAQIKIHDQKKVGLHRNLPSANSDSTPLKHCATYSVKMCCLCLAPRSPAFALCCHLQLNLPFVLSGTMLIQRKLRALPKQSHVTSLTFIVTCRHQENGLIYMVRVTVNVFYTAKKDGAMCSPNFHRFLSAL